MHAEKRTFNITHGTSTVSILQILKWPWVQMAVLDSWAIETQQPIFSNKSYCNIPSADVKYEFNLPLANCKAAADIQKQLWLGQLSGQLRGKFKNTTLQS